MIEETKIPTLSNNPIIKVDVNGKPIYLKRNTLFKDMRIVHPIKNDDGTWNWFHIVIGSWSGFFRTIMMLLLMVLIMFAYAHDTAECKAFIEKNQQLILNITMAQSGTLPDGSIDWSKKLVVNTSSNFTVNGG